MNEKLDLGMGVIAVVTVSMVGCAFLLMLVAALFTIGGLA